MTRAVIAVWGRDSVGVRLSPLNPYNSMRDRNPAGTFSYVATALDRLGIGYLHVAEPGPTHPMAAPAGLRLLRTLRALFRGCFIVDGGRNRTSANHAVSATGADLVALATPFISNPDLVKRLDQRLPLASADPSTFYAGDAAGYPDYPSSDLSPSHRMRSASLPATESGDKSFA